MGTSVTILVTHLERKPLEPIFREILFKQHHLDSDGNKVVRVGTAEYPYHSSFRLYLSTSTPLFMKGDGLYKLPIQKMCVINMGLSDEAIVSCILQETMTVERREFQAQLSTNDNDLVQHNKMLHQENETVLQKVFELDTEFLRDKTIMSALEQCELNLEKHRSILEETNYIRENLELKQGPYIAMANQVATLYALVRKMSVLHPLYYLPFDQFINLFRKVLRARDRGKGASGDILARTQELSDATTSQLFKFITMMMFEKHVILFSLLVAMERMRLKGQLTNEEMSLFINGFQVPDKMEQASPLAEKPSWISDQIWIKCGILESLHQSFQGLHNSFLSNSALWEEYFNRPLTLMNPVPGEELKHLTTFQKCLLWKMYSPEKLCEVSRALIVYELGAVIRSPDHYSIRDVYQYTDKCTPAVFVYPDPPGNADNNNSSTQGFPYVDPLHELKRLAREEGMEGRLRILNFGVHSQIAEVTQAIEDCMNNGYWILLENYHLAEPLNLQTFHLLKTIINSKNTCLPVFDDESDQNAVPVVKSLPLPEPTRAANVCESFRLFVTTSASGGRLLPGILIQHGVKVSCENTKNFRSSLHKSYRNVAYLLNNWLQLPVTKSPEMDTEDKSAFIMPLALLHAILLQRRYYGNLGSVTPNYWSLVDLVSMADVFKTLKVQCSCMETVSEVMTQVYTNQCTDISDAEVVKAIGAAVLKFPGMESSFTEKRTGCGSILDQLLKDGGKPMFNLKSSLDSLHELSASTFSLPDTAEDQLAVSISRVLSRDITQTLGAPELFTTLGNSSNELCLQQNLNLLQAKLSDCPMLAETSRDNLYPLDVFLHYETEQYKKLVRTLQEDSALLLRHAQGEISLSPDLQEIRTALKYDEVPKSWQSFSCPSASSFTEWILSLPDKLHRLVTYVDRKTPDYCYDLSTFLQPGQFLQAVLHDHARQQFQNADLLHYEAQVMPSGFRPRSPPGSGLYLTGLHLHNASWDRSGGHLTEVNPDTVQSPRMPVVWLSLCSDQPNSPPSSSISSSQTADDVYFCPVFCGRQMRDLGSNNVVTRIALPTGTTPKCVWTERSVYLSFR